jgi:hypothetical protein
VWRGQGRRGRVVHGLPKQRRQPGLPPSLSLSVVGLGPTRHVGLAMLLGQARHENGPNRPCLGRRPGTKPMVAHPAGHVVPCQPDPHRAVPARCRASPGLAGPARWPSLEVWWTWVTQNLTRL